MLIVVFLTIVLSQLMFSTYCGTF